MIEPYYQSDRVTLYCGDCLEVMKQLEPGSVDAVVTDPPYNTTHARFEREVPWADWWALVNTLCRDNAPIVMFAAQPFATDLINSNRDAFCYDLVWHKSRSTGFLDANRRPLRAHELILVFNLGSWYAAPYNPQKTQGKPWRRNREGERCPEIYSQASPRNNTASEDGSRYPRSVIDVRNPNKGSLHPTQKPLELMEWLVKTYTNPGDTVLDPFMGSGTTGVACVKTGRRFIGIEISEEYCEIAKRRIREAEAQPALFEVG